LSLAISSIASVMLGNNNKKTRKQGKTERDYGQVVIVLPIEAVYKEELVTLGTTAGNSIGDADLLLSYLV
jgi:hypothetical protein